MLFCDKTTGWIIHTQTLGCMQGQFVVKPAVADRGWFQEKIRDLWAWTVCVCVRMHVYCTSAHIQLCVLVPRASCHLLSCVNSEHRKVWGKVDESLCWLSPPLSSLSNQGVRGGTRLAKGNRGVIYLSHSNHGGAREEGGRKDAALLHQFCGGLLS